MTFTVKKETAPVDKKQLKKVNKFKEELEIILNRIDIAKKQEQEVVDKSSELEVLKKEIIVLKNNIKQQQNELEKYPKLLDEAKNELNEVKEASNREEKEVDDRLKISREDISKIEVQVSEENGKIKELINRHNEVKKLLGDELDALKLEKQGLIKELAEFTKMRVENQNIKDILALNRDSLYKINDEISRVEQEKLAKETQLNEMRGKVLLAMTEKNELDNYIQFRKEDLQRKEEESRNKIMQEEIVWAEKMGELSIKEKSLAIKEKTLEQIKQRIQIVDPSSASKLRI